MEGSEQLRPRRNHIIMEQLFWYVAAEDFPHMRNYGRQPPGGDATHVADRKNLEPVSIRTMAPTHRPDLNLHAISSLGKQLKKIGGATADAAATARSQDKLVMALGLN